MKREHMSLSGASMPNSRGAIIHPNTEYIILTSGTVRKEIFYNYLTRLKLAQKTAKVPFGPGLYRDIPLRAVFGSLERQRYAFRFNSPRRR